MAEGNATGVKAWTSFDEMATEYEVMDLMMGVVRAVRPELVVETGSYNGMMARCIGTALAKNGHGRLVSIEMIAPLAKQAAELVAGLPVEIVHGDSMQWRPPGPIDLIWVDAGSGKLRANNVLAYRESFHQDTIVCIHDSKRDAQHIRHLAHEGLINPVWIPSERGLVIAQWTG